MAELAGGEITYRAMTAGDLASVPLDCHGAGEALRARIADIGSAAILAFDGAQHVGQLQFRRHDPSLRSRDGIWSPDYWGDFGGRGPDLPRATLGVFCYHVGQLGPGQDRDPRYQGRGIGAALLDHLVGWAEANGCSAIVAKAVPPQRPVMRFMGGQPADFYAARGFTLAASWVEPDLHAALVDRGLVPAGSDPEGSARVGMWVKRLAA